MRAFLPGVAGVVLAGLAGCLQESATTCPDHSICGAGYRCSPRGGCVAVDEPCVVDDAVLPDTTPCEVRGTPGVCRDATCVVPRCGDGVVDEGEACDDGNTEDGDGCAASCASDETCGNGVPDFTVDETCDDGNRRNLDGCSGACQAEPLAWRPLGGTPYGFRRAAAYDPDRQRLVTFGGCCGFQGAAFDDTWEWDGANWRRVVTAHAPTPRVQAAMAFDPTRRRIVLFGGDADGPRADLWSYDGADWTTVPQVGPWPAPRYRHALAADPDRGVVMLIGGTNTVGAPLADVWEWTGATWRDTSPVGWAPRTGHGLTYDRARQRMVLFGGTTLAGDDAVIDDTTREFDGAAWSLHAPWPAPRADFACAYDLGRGATIATTGGTSTGRLGDTWTWDGATWTALPIADLPAREAPAGAFDVARGEVVVLGGLNDLELDDTYALGAAGWQLRDPALPPPRYAATVATDRARGRTLLFGGAVQGGMPLDDTWLYDGAWRRLTPPVSPSARGDAAMAFDATTGTWLLCGGSPDGTAVLDDCWRFDGATWSELPLPADAGHHPPARRWHAMTFDARGARVVMFGGVGADQQLRDDTWVLTGDTWQRLPGLAPAPRGRHAMADDPLVGRVVLLGGWAELDGDAVHADAWQLVGETWSPVTAVGAAPTGRAGAVLNDDVTLGGVVVFGGVENVGVQQHTGLTSTSWLLRRGADGVDAWVDLTPPLATPQPRHLAAGFYDAVRAEHVVLGGLGINQLGDAWTLGYRAVAAPEACDAPAGVDTDGDGRSGCDDDDCWARCTPACAPVEATAGVCTPTSTCGDGACDPLEPASCGACP